MRAFPHQKKNPGAIRVAAGAIHPIRDPRAATFMTASGAPLSAPSPQLASTSTVQSRPWRRRRRLAAQAAIILLRSDNTALISDVLAGRVSILQAAAQVRRVVDLVTAYKLAQDPDRVAFARACGIERMFNVLVAASS
jgi:hypothetical protein